MVLLVLQGAAFLVLHAVARGDDLLHPLLHLATGAVGLLVRRIGGPLALSAYGLAFGVAYAVVLGLGGATGTLQASVLELSTGDHVFHVVFGTFLAVVSAAGLRGVAPPARRAGLP